MARGEYTHIEIPADDLDRAKRFYTDVFGWDLGSMGGMEDYLVYRTGGVGGGIGKRGTTAGKTIRNYITVTSLDEAEPIVERAGGRIVQSRREVPGMGSYTVVTDSEGNEIAIWQDA
ncbi:MAG: VOC family protein [Chloroflexota bacterium]